MSGNSTRPASPGTTELSYNLPSYQAPTQHHQQYHHQGQPQYQASFGDPQESAGKAQLSTLDQPSTSLEGLHVSVPHTTGSTRPNLSLDASLASSLTANLSTILGSASSTWSTQPSLQYPSVQGYSHPGSISGTPESHSRPGSVGPHGAGHQQSHKMEGSPYESSWRNHYGQSTASNGYNLGNERDQYAYGIAHNAYNRAPAGYPSYSGAPQPHHLMTMATSSTNNNSAHAGDIPREPYIPPGNVSNAHSSATFQPRPAVTGYPPNAYNMAVAAHQLQASQHGHGYPGSHVSNALLHNYSSSPIAISGLSSASHNASPAASSYNVSGLVSHQNQNQSPYAAAAAAVGHPIGSGSTSPGNTPGSSGTFTDMRNGLAGPTAARKTKYTRSRTGCLACRVKRVKCDETRPECKRCIGAKRDCVFPSLADLPKATIRALTAKKRKESGSDLDDSGAMNSGDVSTATSANVSGDETDSVRSRILPPAPAYQANPYNPYSAANGPYAVATATYAPHAAAYSQMYGGDRSMHLQADWQNRLQGQDSNRSHQPSRTGTPNLSAVVAAQNPLHSPKIETGSDDGQAEIKAEHIPTTINGAVDESSRLYLSQQRNELLAMHQPSYYTASSTLPRLSSPNFLLPWFPTPLERGLILHYCANAATLMMAIPSGLSGLNPILAVNLPLSLSAPRGENKAVDALRLSLLGVGAIHQAFLFAKNQNGLNQTSSLLSRARTLREAARDMLLAASQDAEMAKHDAAIAAGATNALIDIFFGGVRWEENFKLVKDLIHRRGGPAAMVSASRSRTIAEGGTTQTSRLLLETLSIYDVMSCLAVGKQPTLLADGGSDWWLRPNLSTSEMHSVEKQFGMSRTMVYMLFRTAKLLADLDDTGVILSEKRPQLVPVRDINDDSSSVDEEAILSLDRLEQISNMSSGKTAELWNVSHTLLEDIETWIKVLKRERTEHERVHLGNLAYANAMKIILLYDVLRRPRTVNQVQECCLAVLQHCSECSALLNMSIDLTWPVIICSSAVDEQYREWVMNLYQGFQSQCCFDVEKAIQITKEIWRRRDAGEPGDSWRSVCRLEDMDVLLV